MQALKEHDIECDYVTGGGTGTFHYEAASGIFTEVQPISSCIFLMLTVLKMIRKLSD